MELSNAVSDAEPEAPRQTTADDDVMLKHNLRAMRRDATGSRSASGTYRRLQAVAVDRVMGEEKTFERSGRTFARRMRRPPR
jgi:hypothetical protein